MSEVELIEKGEKELIALMKGDISSDECECSHCKADGVDHQIIDQPDGHTDRRSRWGEGIPTTIRICTACKRWDGGWVSADIVGGGW